MSRNLRRLDLARSWQHAREQFAAIVAERDQLRLELRWTRQSLNEVREAMRELQAAVLARRNAEAALAGLYRERAITRAQAADRDPATRLH